MKHYLRTFDGDTVYLNDEEADKVASIIANPQASEAKFINLKGNLLAVSAIKELKRMDSREVNQSSRVSQKDLMLMLTSGKSTGFWQDVVRENLARKENGLPWLYEEAVQFAKRESGFTAVSDIVEFINAEWEAVKEHNRPRITTL